MCLLGMSNFFLTFQPLVLTYDLAHLGHQVEVTPQVHIPHSGYGWEFFD